MTIFDRLLGREAVKAQTPVALKAVFGGGVYNTGPLLSSVSPEPQRKAAQFLQAYKCGWFYKAESKISGDLARSPWSVSDGDIESDDPEETIIGRPDLDIPFESLNPIEQFMRLMERPNPKQTGRQLRQKTFIRRDMAGWTFWYLEAASVTAPITAIYGISPSRLWPSYDKRSGELLGWVLDFDKNGGTMTFEPWEIVTFANSTPDEDDTYGVGVVEAVFAELPLTDLMTRHTADLLTTGGRVAGMMWPRERALDEDEFTDAQRAWRNVVSDPNAARRLLLFPEPMEYASGASTPAEIGIPELAVLNRDNILTAFPIAPEILGVPMPGGMNASGETRRELYDFYWEGTIQPRAQSYDEVIQTVILSRYEALMGQTFRYETELPDLDDANTLLEKAGAFKSLTALGFDDKSVIKAVGLDHIKWNGKPEPPPQLLPPGQPDEEEAPLSATVSDDTSGSTSVTQVVSKGIKSRESITDANDPRLREFLTDQRARVEAAWRDSFPKAKGARMEWTKAVDWWDKAAEDRLLRETLSVLYLQAARGSLQVVADTLDRIVPNRAVSNIVADLNQYGGQRIVGINEHTLEAVQANLAEGTRRGYSLSQLIEGVPTEQYTGLRELPVFDDARAEVIARTETMLSYNRAALDAYGEFGVTEVQAYDGDDFDEECRQRDGQTFTIEEALAIEDHPNGTLDWAPVTDKAWGAQPVPHAVKVDVGSPIVNVHLPENVVNVPEQAVPIVNVTTPEPVVNVAPAEVHVTTPDVTVRPAVVNVPAPVVNVSSEKPEVHVEVKAEPEFLVTVNPEMRITSMPDRVTRRKVKRERGVIVETTDIETDG